MKMISDGSFSAGRKLVRLLRLSHQWGSDVRLIQGPGGNFSAKIGENIWIKSSGVMLKNVSREAGFSEIYRERFLSEIPKPRDSFLSKNSFPTDVEEKGYIDAIRKSQVETSDARPSMEAGFHAALPHEWVLHVHSIAGTIAGLMASSNPICKNIFQPVLDAGYSVVRIPPAVPGLHLTWEIQKRFVRAPSQKGILWVLENHGLVWAANDVDHLVQVAEAFESHATQILEIGDLKIPDWERNDPTVLELKFSDWPYFYLENKAIFPDYAVFFPKGAEQPKIQGRTVLLPTSLPASWTDKRREFARELIFAQAAVASAAQMNGCYRPLPDSIVEQVANLEIEALRLKQSARLLGQ